MNSSIAEWRQNLIMSNVTSKTTQQIIDKYKLSDEEIADERAALDISITTKDGQKFDLPDTIRSEQ